MEMKYEKLLEGWGLDFLSESFREEGITDESFDLLDDDTINVLIPKAGPRLIFKKKFESHVNKILPKSPETTIVRNYKYFEETASTCSTETADSMIIMNPDEELKVLLESFDGCSEVEDNLNNSKNSSKRKVPLTEDEPSNKMAKIPSIFYPLDMESILKKTPEGNVLLFNRNKLNNEYRNKLSKILVNELIFATGKSIKREAFVKVCEEIIQLFPNEVAETYYIPYISSKHGLRKQAARGKLWSRYLNVRALLRMTTDPKKMESEAEGERNDSDEVKNDLVFLESAVEPFVRVLESWERTFGYRLNLFKEPSFEIDKIFDKFPCLKMPYALELFEADFNRIYPEKIDIVYSEGPKICKAIIKESEERKVSPFKEDIEDANKKALFLLPYMFSPVTIKKGKSSSGIYRPTRKEVQESFFVQAENFEEIEDLISKRSKLLDPFEIPIQPFMAEVGNHFFIYFYGMKYKLDSSLRTLELLYKIYHSLNLEYPPESKHVWQVIQEAIFKMPMSGKSSNVVTFLNDLKVHIV